MTNPRQRTRRLSSNLCGVELVVWIWIACIVTTLAISQQKFYTNGRYGKRLESRESPSFWTGSRYGRSDARSNFPTSVTKLLEVGPRGDRFFLGSRYGKRAGGRITPDLTTLKHLEVVPRYPHRARYAKAGKTPFAMRYVGGVKRHQIATRGFDVPLPSGFR